MQTEQCGISVGAERVHIVKEQVLELRTLCQEAQQNSVSQEIRNFVPVSNRMKTLQRHIVRVVGRFSSVASPSDERRAQALAHFLRLFIQNLLRHLLPEKAQVMHGRNHAQADGAARREQQWTRITIVALPPQELVDWLMGQIARRKNMRQRDTGLLGDFPAFREVCLDESPMSAS